MSVRFNIWFKEKDLEKVKAKAQKENRKTSDYIRLKALEETPNLALGNWWDSPDKIRKILHEIKKEKKK